MRRVLFLDIDGVLNHRAWLAKAKEESRVLPYTSDADFAAWHASQIDPACVRCLNRIVEETDCDVILSSSWRYLFQDLADASAFFSSVGFLRPLAGMTPKASEAMSSGRRDTEIKAWMHDAGVSEASDAIAVLDDEPTVLCDLLRFLVRCTPEAGLTPALAMETIARLKSKSPNFRGRGEKERG